jgi:hyaluronate lyase
MGATAFGKLGWGSGLLAAVDADTAADEFDGLRARWLELLTGGSAVDPADPLFAGRLTGIGRAATSLRATMAPSSTALWSDLPFDASSSVTGSYTRLQRMALAYASPGTELTGYAGLAADVVAGLDHVYAHAYNEDASFFGNRDDWQVGGPSALLDCCVLVWEQLSADRLDGYLRAVDHFVPDPTRMLTGEPAPRTSRVSLGWIVARRGIAGRNAGKLTAARDALSQIFTPATNGDGFYRDGSFVHHKRVAYTGTYGEGVLDLLSRFLWVLTGSTWAISQANRQFIYDAVDTTFAPFIYRGLMMDSVRGRAISRRTETDHLDGHRVIGDALWLARTAPAAQAQRLRALSKGWIGRDSFSSYLDSGQVSVPDVALAKAALDDPTPPADEPVYHRQFHYMDRVVHRRPGWSVAISMASKRIAWFESLNGENLRGWHTGAGTMYTYSPRQLGQYTQDFWATSTRTGCPASPCHARRSPMAARARARPHQPTSAGWAVRPTAPMARWASSCGAMARRCGPRSHGSAWTTR